MQNELAASFDNLVNSGEEFEVWKVLVAYFPILEWIVSVSRTKMAP